MSLEKALLEVIDASPQAKLVGRSLSVQFNPTSLRLQAQNTIEGNRSTSRQVRQFIGSSSTTLSMELVFDTADEGTTAAPVPVTDRTALLRELIRPGAEKKQPKETPPKVRFTWGRIVFEGIVEGLTEEFDLFASNGVALRSKVQLTIKEQNAELAFNERGPGAATTRGAPEAGGGGGAGPGTIGIGGSLTATALGGESVAEFAARVGIDPAGWRGIAGGLEGTLSLSAGAEIDFPAGLSVGAGIGATFGLEAGASASLEASFGLDASFGVSAAASASVGAAAGGGFALSAAGGVSAAIETVAAARADAASSATVVAFSASLPPRGGAISLATAAIAAPPSAAPPRPAKPAQARPRLASTGFPSRAAQQRARPVPPPPATDPRAKTFGFGVPLRPRRGNALDGRAAVLSGSAPLRPRAGAASVPFTRDPTVPRWVALREGDAAARAADKVTKARHPGRACGCAGGADECSCGCGGGCANGGQT
jgi:hypothetical protein